MSLRFARMAAALLVCAVQPGLQGTAPTPDAQPAPDVRVEYFGPARGYATGTADVDMVCVVRNEGNVSLPDRRLRLRCYILSGLDYTTGETMPLLPALAPGQAVAYHWRLTPTDASSPLAVAALLTNVPPPAPGAAGVTAPASGAGKGPSAPSPETPAMPPAIAPGAALAVIPRLVTSPSDLPDLKAPAANASPERAWIGNDRVLMRVLASRDHLPLLLLSAKQGPGWRTVATGVSLVRVLSSEDGQQPWWETFRWQGARVTNDKTAATLTLTGTAGSRWQAELTLQSGRDTCVIQGRLRLTPLEAMRLQGVQLPTLIPANVEPAALAVASGVATPVAADISPLPQDQRVAAGLQDRVTFGLAWPSESPLPGWRGTRQPESPVAPRCGMRWESDEGRAELVSRGQTLEFPFRLFAFTPSDTVKDAARFRMP
ncbi:MAG TPA: hypothetical protein VKT32_02075 [Chthonomonadaceae bacterium]|nr:hypothetical protein [Chthonomonadaceae bacterium]